MIRLMLVALILATAGVHAQTAQSAAALTTIAVRSGGGLSFHMAASVVEAVRQTLVSAQVAGELTQISVRAGDAVKAGQLLARIDARAAEQVAAAGAAQADAARAELNVATRDFARQKQLFERNFISRAALDRAETQFATAQAQATSLLAQAGASMTQARFYTLTAPYAGIVAELPVTVGDMVLPGRVLMTIYDPSRLRVTASVPQSVAALLVSGKSATIDLPGAAHARQAIIPDRIAILPAADPSTHTVQVQMDLPASATGLVPGMYATTRFVLGEGGGAKLFVPRSAVTRRAELNLVYVISESGKAMLRQVKLGPVLADEVEILAGLAAGERVAAEPLVAARQP